MGELGKQLASGGPGVMSFKALLKTQAYWQMVVNELKKAAEGEEGIIPLTGNSKPGCNYGLEVRDGTQTVIVDMGEPISREWANKALPLAQTRLSHLESAVEERKEEEA